MLGVVSVSSEFLNGLKWDSHLACESQLLRVGTVVFIDSLIHSFLHSFNYFVVFLALFIKGSMEQDKSEIRSHI